MKPMKTMNFSGGDAHNYYTMNKEVILEGGGFNVTQTNCKTELNN